MSPTEQIKARIRAFSEEWVVTNCNTSPASQSKDIDMLAACIEQLVDEAVREAILITAKTTR